jgi:hypothetical protein
VNTTLEGTILLPEPAQPAFHTPVREDPIYRVLVGVSSPEPAISREVFFGIDWDALLLQARHHSLTPLLAHWLLEAEDIPLPAQVRARLRSEFQSNLRRNFSLFEETRRIVAVWREAGIEAVPYKGPVLAEQLWGSFALRECSDLDFLVRREDVHRAGDAVIAAGYQREAEIADSLRSAFLRDASEEQFRLSRNHMLLELQWAPVPRTLSVPFDECGLWGRVGEMEIAGETVNAFSAEDLFALLAIHGWKHNWSKLIWVADLAAMMNKHQLHWDAIHRTATQFRWRRILLLALEMVRRVYGPQAGVEPFVSPDAKVQAVATRLEQNLHLARNNSYFEWHRDMLEARDSRTCQIRQLARFILTPGLGDYSSFRLPGWASPAYRLVRLGRVIGLSMGKAVE